MKSINIKGKEYYPVHERVLYFRNEEAFKGWSIITEIINIDDERVTFKASIADDEGNIKATGHSYELQADKSSFVNKTSFVENAETSAVGRALGLLGIGIENAFASADEVANAQRQQNNPDLDKPWLSQSQFNKAIDRIRSNDPGEFDSIETLVKNIEDKFRMKKEYKKALYEELESDFNKAVS